MHELCARRLGWRGAAQCLLYVHFAFGWEAVRKTHTNTFPMTFTEWTQVLLHWLSSSNTALPEMPFLCTESSHSPRLDSFFCGYLQLGREELTQPLAHTVVFWMAVPCFQATRLSLTSDLCPGTYEKDYHMQMLTNLDYREGKINPRWPFKSFLKKISLIVNRDGFQEPALHTGLCMDAVRITDVVIFSQPFENNCTNSVTPIWGYQQALGYGDVISEQPMRARVGNVFPLCSIRAGIHGRMVLTDI